MIADLKPYPAMKDSGVLCLGDVPEHWDVRRLKRAFRRIVGGSTPSSAEASYWDGDITWVTPADVSRGERLRGSLRRITHAGLRSCSTEVVPAGSIVVTSRAPVGNVALAETELCTNQGCKALIIDDTVMHPLFGFQVLKAMKGELQSLASGTTFTEISTSRFGTVPIPIPPLPEQAAIVRFLDYADRRIRRYIRAKQKLIKLLEEQKQAIIHRAVTRGLDPNVRLKPSGVGWLGDVPEHWEVRRLKTLCGMRSGDGITGMSIEPAGDYPVYGGNGVRGYTSSYTHDGEFALIGRQGALCGNVHLARGRFWASEHAVVASLRSGHILDWFGAILLVMNLNQYSIAAAQPGLAVERVLNLWLPVPPTAEQAGIADQIEHETAGIGTAMDRAHREISLLREYRTRLIADVVTGKLDVREAAARLPDEPEEPEPFVGAEAPLDGEESHANDLDAIPEEAEA
jgi:type I restriction enzyme S subunit